MEKDEVVARNKVDREAKLVEWLKKQLEKARTQTQIKRRTWVRLDKLWRNYRYTKPTPWRANVFNPISFFLIETILPQMVLQTFQDAQKLLYIRPTGSEDIELAEKTEKMINFQLMSEMNVYLQMCKFMKCTLIFGTAFAKVLWNFSKNVTSFKYSKLYNILVDTDADDMEDDPWLAHEDFFSFMYIKQQERDGIFHNVDKVKGSTSGKTTETNETERIRGLQQVDPDRNIKLTEWWGNAPESLIIENGRWDVLIPTIVTLANEKIVVRAEPNPFTHNQPPFVMNYDHIDLFDFYGVGEIEPIESLQWMSNDLFNQYLDGRNLELNQMWKASKNAGIEYNTLVSRPGGIVLLDIMDGLERLDFKNQTLSSIADQNHILSTMQLGMGVSSVSAGQLAPKVPETATGTELLQAAAGKRVAIKMLNLQLLSIMQLGKFAISLNKQLMPDEKQIRIYNADGAINFEPLRREDIELVDFDVTPVPVPLLGSANMLMNQLVQVMNVALQAQSAGVPTDITPILQKYFDLIPGNKLDAKRIIQGSATNPAAQVSAEETKRTGGQNLQIGTEGLL